MKTLEELTIKYDVDALELGYTSHYASLFNDVRNDITKVLEIGVETGRSHRMWLEYFPNATLYGFDIFKSGVEEFHRLQAGNPYLDRSVMFEGNQENIDDLKKFLSLHGRDFDIIIDDGGHTMKQQQISLGVLFDVVKSGGHYIIEDLHTCSGQWPTLYGYEVIQSGDILTTDLLKSFKNKDNSITETNYLSQDILQDIRDNLESCEIKIGKMTYKNPKGVSYHWPTMLSFMKKI
jgi:SAM-dependent methyltransferase|tara:strand:- start:1445 stop:2149 length:705 start_codon:yes stop_codon:yes gene_type:complete